MPQKMRVRVPYGVASVSRIGGLSDIFSGQIMTPNFASGDAKITQDDGTGTDNLDTLPSVDGTDVLLPISAAEATALTAPGTNGRNRIVQLYDQGTKAWVDLDIVVETEGNSHLATFPNGVIYGLTPTAKGAGTFTGPAAMQTEVNPLYCVAVVYASDEPLDVGAAMVVDGWTAATQVATGTAGWTRTPTGTTSTLRIAIYPNPKDAALALLATLQASADAVKAKTDNLPSDPADESLVIAATDAIYARLGAPAGASIAADIAGVAAGSGLTEQETIDAVTEALTAYNVARPTSRQGQSPDGT